MPVKTIEKTVDGHEVKIVTFNGVRGFKLKTRLYKVLLPVLGPMLPALTSAMRSGKSTLTFMDIDVDEMLPEALNQLAMQMDEEKFFKLILDLLSGTFVGGQSITEDVFNELFIANYFLAYKLVAQVISANRFLALGDIGKVAGLSANLAKMDKSSE